MDRRPKVPRAAMVGPTVARGVAAWLAPLGRCARGVRQPRPARMPVALARATGFGRITRLHPLDIGGHAAGLHHPELEGRESRHQDRGQRRNAGVAAETADTTMVIVTIRAVGMEPGGRARASIRWILAAMPRACITRSWRGANHAIKTGVSDATPA